MFVNAGPVAMNLTISLIHIPSFEQCIIWFSYVDWANEVRLVVTALLLASVICVGIASLPTDLFDRISMVFPSLPAWTRYIDRIPYFEAPMKSQDLEQDCQPRSLICCGPRTFYKPPTRRTVMTDDTICLYAWPSRGGLIVLEGTDAIDFTFLGLDRLDPPLRRDSDQAAEDSFCQQLLLLGAKWWDSEERYRFLAEVSERMSPAISELDEEKKPYPTMREKRWVKVGWPSKPPGGLWVAEFETDMYDIEEEENRVPEDAARVMLARDMDERCEILRRLGGRFFGSLDEYEGEAFLRAWDEKVEGEVGPLVKTSYME